MTAGPASFGAAGHASYGPAGTVGSGAVSASGTAMVRCSPYSHVMPSVAAEISTLPSSIATMPGPHPMSNGALGQLHIGKGVSLPAAFASGITAWAPPHRQEELLDFP